MRGPYRFHRAFLAIALAVFADGCAGEEDDDDATTPAEEGPTPTPTPASSPDSPALIISDGGNFRVDFLRPDTRQVFYQIDLTTLFEECDGESGFCVLTGLRHSVHNDQDFLDMNLGQVDSEDQLDNPATVRRIRLTDPPTPVYTLRHFDFSGLPNGTDLCDYDPADPCGGGRLPTCNIAFPHDLDVLVDDPERQYVELLITDLATQRVLKVDFDYGGGNTCGRVDWVLDSRTEGWEVTFLPNDADLFELDGAQYLLTSYYSTDVVLGTGAIHLWKRLEEDTPWQRLWSFPDPASVDMPFLNTPHSPILYEDPIDGGLKMRYGHSRGDASWWRLGYEGSLGMAELDSIESPPVYLYESRFPPGHELTPTGFIRSVERLPDGRFLVADSGCELYFNCPLPGRVYIVELEDWVPAEGLSGAYSPDRAYQNFGEIDMSTLEAYVCGYSTTYEADYLTLGSMGADLRARWHDELRGCPAP